MNSTNQRTNFHLRDFPVVPAPAKRVHSLLDVCELLARKKPRKDDSRLEETEWLLVPEPSSTSVPRVKEVESPLPREHDTPRPLEADIQRVEDDNVVGFQCPVCEKMYRRRCRVVEHMKLRHNPEGVPRYQCSEATCLRTYCRLDALKMHQKTDSHLGSKVLFEPTEGKPDPPQPAEEQKPVEAESSLRYKCSVSGCEKTYSTRYRCNMHMTACHESNCEKPFICPVPGCPKAYATKDSLTRHKRTAGHNVEGGSEKKPENLVPEPPKPDQQTTSEEVSATFHDRVQELVELFDEIK